MLERALDLGSEEASLNPALVEPQYPLLENEIDHTCSAYF